MTTYYLEYPPFQQDEVKILTESQWRQELPANHRYERVEVGPRGDYATTEEMRAAVARMNDERR